MERAPYGMYAWGGSYGLHVPGAEPCRRAAARPPMTARSDAVGAAFCSVGVMSVRCPRVALCPTR